jgi:hypothetical protein
MIRGISSRHDCRGSSISALIRSAPGESGVLSHFFLLVLLCRQFDEVVDIIGFFKNGAFLKNHVISIRYLLCDSVVLDDRSLRRRCVPHRRCVLIVELAPAILCRATVRMVSQEVLRIAPRTRIQPFLDCAMHNGRQRWVRFGRCANVGRTAVVPEKADDLVQRPSRQPRAKNGLMHCAKERLTRAPIGAASRTARRAGASIYSSSTARVEWGARLHCNSSLTFGELRQLSIGLFLLLRLSCRSRWSSRRSS